MPEQQRKTLVRGPDGALWLLSSTDEPVRLNAEQTQTVEGILTNAETALSGEFQFMGHGVHVGSDCFDGHGVHCEGPETSLH